MFTCWPSTISVRTDSETPSARGRAATQGSLGQAWLSGWGSEVDDEYLSPQSTGKSQHRPQPPQQRLLSTCHVPDTVLDAGDLVSDRTDPNPALIELTCWSKQRINKVISKVLGSGPSDAHNNDSIELGPETASGHSELIKPPNQQVKTGVTVLAGMTDPDQQGKWTAAPQGGREEPVWHTWDPSGRLLVSPHPAINPRHAKPQQRNSGSQDS